MTSYQFHRDGKIATCADGVQNQGESGIDCGGQCDACLGMI